VVDGGRIIGVSTALVTADELTIYKQRCSDDTRAAIFFLLLFLKQQKARRRLRDEGLLSNTKYDRFSLLINT
jgi:hypothetical protein